MSLQARNLELVRGGRTLCSELSFSVEPGQRWCILGPNGSGKTTLLHTLAGLAAADAGEVLLNGKPLASVERGAAAREIGLLPQDHLDPFPATVMETALLGRHPHLRPWQWEGAADMEHANAALTAVGLQPLSDRDVATLSGGERRRLGFATLLTQDPRYLLLDEPTNHLDLRYQIELLHHLGLLATEQARAVVMVLHDVNLAARFADHFVLMLPDATTRTGDRETALQTSLLEQLYGHPLNRGELDGHPVWQAR